MTHSRGLIFAAVFAGLVAGIPQTSLATDVGARARTKEQYETLMANQWKHMVRGTTAALAEPKTAADLAAFTRNYYNALVDRGFSKDEALTLVGRMSLPLGGGRPVTSD